MPEVCEPVLLSLRLGSTPIHTPIFRGLGEADPTGALSPPEPGRGISLKHAFWPSGCFRHLSRACPVLWAGLATWLFLQSWPWGRECLGPSSCLSQWGLGTWPST